MATKKLELHDTIKTWMEKINDNLTVIDGIEVADFEQLVNAANTIEEKLVEVDESVSLSKDWANKTDATVDGVEYSAKKYALDAKDSEETSVLSATVAGTKAVEANASVVEARNYVDDIYSAQTVIELSDSRIVNLSPPPGTSISNPKLLGMTMAFMGTGANNSPTGSFRFVPPNGWTVNGSSSEVVFSDFNKPAFFVIYYYLFDYNILISLI